VIELAERACGAVGDWLSDPPVVALATFEYAPTLPLPSTALTLNEYDPGVRPLTVYDVAAGWPLEPACPAVSTK
jgi:hypothetical protein